MGANISAPSRIFIFRLYSRSSGIVIAFSDAGVLRCVENRKITGETPAPQAE
jgi:hypothetical protein